MSEGRELKIVIVGDGGVGKTCLCTTFKTKEFPPEKYEPTVFETHPMQVDLNGEKITVNVWDTAGQEEYSEIRK